MMGGEAPKTCWATHKRQVINLWNCCILLVDLFELYELRTSNRLWGLKFTQQCNWGFKFCGMWPSVVGWFPDIPLKCRKPFSQQRCITSQKTRILNICYSYSTGQSVSSSVPTQDSYRAVEGDIWEAKERCIIAGWETSRVTERTGTKIAWLFCLAFLTMYSYYCSLPCSKTS
jgi:hypothetical protein